MRRKTSLFFFIILTCSMLPQACTHKTAQTRVDLDRFSRVYVHYLALCAADTAKIELQQVYLDSALAREKLSRPEYERILQALTKDPLLYQELSNIIEEPVRALLPKKEEPIEKTEPDITTARPR